MAKGFFIAGVIGSVITGMLLRDRLIHLDSTASVVSTGVGHSCPTLGVAFDKSPAGLPRDLTACACPTPPVLDSGATPLHLPNDIVQGAAPLDQVVISYTEFTSPLGGGGKLSGLSFVLVKSQGRQTFIVSSQWPPYSSFALPTAAPFLAGLVLSIILSFLPGKKGVAD